MQLAKHEVNGQQRCNTKTTTVAILQPSYLPWLGYFDQIMRSDIFVIYDDVAFDKHGWRNRNRIKGHNGALWLTVPVLHKGRVNQILREVEIDATKGWSNKHLRTLEQYYRKSPYYDWLMPSLVEVFNDSGKNLVELNLRMMSAVLDLLAINTQIYRSSELNIVGSRTDRLISICQYFSATHYLTGDSAINYLDQNLFKKADIEIIWQNYQHPVYQQPGEFIPYLSTVDLLFNHGPDSKSILLNARLKTNNDSGTQI